MKGKGSTKRHAKEKHSPALKPVPGKIASLLRLVNLLPGDIRHPYWAVTDRNFEKAVIQRSQITQILEWNPNEKSYHAFIAEQLGKEIPGWLCYNNPPQLWFTLSLLLEGLPLILQAFVLEEDDGKLIKDEGQLGTRFIPVFMEPDFQTEQNFSVLSLNENELAKVIRVARTRIEMAFSSEIKEREREDGIVVIMPEVKDVDIEGTKFTPRSAEHLVLRARQRLIFILAAQELISCITHPEPQKQLWHCTVVPRSEAARPRPYIDKETGRFSLRSPILFYCLEGIEARRVRECPICYQFFWAGRLDMKCCSTKCAHAQRSRKYRIAYKQKYAYQRYSKALKEEKAKTKSKLGLGKLINEQELLDKKTNQNRRNN